jgi:cell division protein FtsQ
MTTYAPVRPRAHHRPAPIDPRIRARRVEVVRAAGRRRLHRLLWVLGFAAVAAAATGAVLSPLLDINQIAVQGVDGAHADEVRAAIGIKPGQPLLLVDTGAAVTHVRTLRWVEDVRVERQLPGTLRVEVIPRFAVAWRSAGDGAVVLLDRAGAVISHELTPPAGLPQVDAARGDLGAAARVAAALSETLRPQVKKLVVRGGQVGAVLVRGAVIRFGDASQARAKVAAAEAVLHAVGLTPISYVDVSVPSAPVTG